MAETELLKSIGFKDQLITDTLKNKQLKAALLEVLDEAKVTQEKGCNPEVGATLNETAKHFPKTAAKHRAFFIKYVLEGKIGKGPHFDAAIAFFKKTKDAELDAKRFEEECGIGISTSDEEVEKTIAKVLEDNKEKLATQRYKLMGTILTSLYTEHLKWADRGKVKKELDTHLEKLLGPKGAQDHEKKQTKKPRKKMVEKIAEGNVETQLQESISFPNPKENIQLRPDTLERHLKETSGSIVTRFPPEPNGYLHIGHAKAMSLNFGYPKKLGGICYMRFDDTNPETEKQEYIDGILENVKWLGHKWYKITYASDYFPQLYKLAIELIRRGKAYVDEQTPEEIAKFREEKRNSPFRDRPINESLKLFEGMKKGKFEEGSKTLRMKMNMQSDNPCMRDLIAYRIKHTPHPRTGDEWCIYPSYDYTHCLCDSIENITHSLCTLEFEVRRESYNWLIDALELYRPVVWEYGRLNLTHTVLSKRKLILLVKEGYVRGWNDPRLSTLNGFRRRGYTPEGINNFCEEIGVTRKTAVVNDIEQLEYFVREHLNEVAHRKLAVLDPLKVTITNWKGGIEYVEASNIPGKTNFGTRKVPFTGTVYIEQADFREKDIKNYFGLALKTADGKRKEVRLKYAYNIAVTDVVKDADGTIVELKAEYDPLNTNNQPHGHIHWVADTSKEGKKPLTAEVRLYERLFKSKFPGELEDWRADVNTDSLAIVTAFLEPSCIDLKVEEKIQFERLGYFCVDKDTTSGHLVFNRTFGLKESRDKPKK